MIAPWLRRAGSRVFLVCLFVLGLGSAVWGAFALWFQLPFGTVPRMAAAGLFALLGTLALATLFSRRLRLFGLFYALAFLAILIGFARIMPSNDRDFAPDVAHGVTGVVHGDELTLQNVRNFSWTTPAEFNEVWEERRYDLSKLDSADFYLVYFMGPLIAHSMVSFGFSDGRHLMFSIEIRRERHEEFSAIAGFFKRYGLVFLAADERDYLFLRKANREDVRLYRLKISKEAARALLLQYVREANELAVHPHFYNTLTANCTTTIFLMLRALSPSFPLDWRVLLNGHLPSFAYEHNLVDTSIPLSELIARAAVTDRIKMGLSETAFGARLREGLPKPD